MKKLYCYLAILSCFFYGRACASDLVSVDTFTLNRMIKQGQILAAKHPDSATRFMSQVLQLCQQTGYDEGSATSLLCIGINYLRTDKPEKALGFLDKAIGYGRKVKAAATLRVKIYNALSVSYIDKHKPDTAAAMLHNALDEIKESKLVDPFLIMMIYNNVVVVQQFISAADSSRQYLHEAEQLASRCNDATVWPVLLYNKATFFAERKGWDSALHYYDTALNLLGKTKPFHELETEIRQDIATTYLKKDQSNTAAQLRHINNIRFKKELFNIQLQNQENLRNALVILAIAQILLFVLVSYFNRKGRPKIAH